LAIDVWGKNKKMTEEQNKLVEKFCDIVVKKMALLNFIKIVK
jgi:hypothetical protein